MFYLQPSARQNWNPCPTVPIDGNLSLHGRWWEWCSHCCCLQQKALYVTQPMWNAPQPGKGQAESREKQKSSYSTGTGGTIAPAPAVHAVLVHRRLQFKHRVSTAVSTGTHPPRTQQQHGQGQAQGHLLCAATSSMQGEIHRARSDTDPRPKHPMHF